MYEYKIKRVYPKTGSDESFKALDVEVERIMNTLASQGWEYINTYAGTNSPGGYGMAIVFKRPRD